MVRAAVPLGLVGAAAGISILAHPLLAPLEARSEDVRLRLRGEPPPAVPVVAVPVDAAALGRFGRFPWESDVVPGALAALHAAGARAVVFDFPIAPGGISVPAEETRGMTELEAAEYLLRRAHVSHANALARLEATAPTAVPADLAAAVLGRFMPDADGSPSLEPARVPTVLAYSVARHADEVVALPGQEVREPAFLDRFALPLEGFGRAPLPEAAAIDLPPDDAADAFGAVLLAPDPDGTVRRIAPVLRLGDRVLLSLPLAAVLEALGADASAVSLEDGLLRLPPSTSMPNGDAAPRAVPALPLDRLGRARIGWVDDAALETLPFTDLVDRGTEPDVRARLAGALAVVYLAPSRGGVPTPAGVVPPGRVHAHAARAILAGDAVRDAPRALANAWLGLIAAALAGAGLAFPAGRLVPAALLLAAVHVAGAFALVPAAGVLVPLLAPLALIATGATALVWRSARAADAERRRLDRLVAELRDATDDADLRARLTRLELDVERTPLRLGAYRLTALIERGGMGAVFRAIDEPLQRPVAVKIVTDADADLRARFRREAEIVARITHPNVVQIHGVGEHAGIPYFAMELVEGVSLARRLASGGPMEPVEALRLAATIARGLHAAHERGIVHRDVKPSNVLLAGAVPKIVDFGVARAGESGLTGTGEILGTADYMSPEQAQGLTLDHRSDIYSLGVTLFRMLAGTLPFSSESAVGVIYKHVNLPAPDLREARPDLAPEIGQLLAEMLAKQPTQRPESAALLADRLEALAETLASRAARSNRG